MANYENMYFRLTANLANAIDNLDKLSEELKEMQKENEGYFIINTDYLPNTTRTIDELGRIVLPVELRKELGWQERETIDIFLNPIGELILKQSIKKCVFCGNSENLKDFNKKSVCPICISELHVQQQKPPSSLFLMGVFVVTIFQLNTHFFYNLFAVLLMV